tara:strand:- start:1176 stop:1439 length:264 start_codon:yes stop_codon:yes gene_type:complete
MSLNIEELKKKIIYRSTYRGSKEMDRLLFSFSSSIMDNLDENELKNLLNLLNVDDENLYNFRIGKKININIENNRITKMFKNYILTK